MFFHVVETEDEVRRATEVGAYLIHDNWNDWFKFKTMYTLYIVDVPGIFKRVGSVKIGEKGMTDATAVPALPTEFDELDESFFSVGQDEDYYQTINQATDLRARIYAGLRDCAYDQEIFLGATNEYVMGESLLRSLNVQTVRGRLHRLAHGNAERTKFAFVYSIPSTGESGDTELRFDVNPVSRPPTNVHVLIGRNGVGKTRCLSGIIGAILGRNAPDGSTPGVFRQENNEDMAAVSNLISVSFSAFDSADPLPASTVGNRVQYAYIGLKVQPPATPQLDPSVPISTPPPTNNLPKGKPQLAEEFAHSMRQCQVGLRKERWLRVLQTLETDPLFKEAEVASFATTDTDGDWKMPVIDKFDRLSSGHAIVLLTVTRLVELVEERSLVLIDEPEGHLHPPLLSAFVRALSNLLVQRNGVAIVATHSPVVLQEVPRACVWVLTRSRTVSRADRPQIETFGENVGVLTREIFGLEVVHSGFHSLIAEAVGEHEDDYEGVLGHFGNQLGTEARAIARGLSTIWEPGDPEDPAADEGV
ncbi:MAG: ATP-binding protein [Acidobacteria bacterium]|nr:ATP-binding protein [Acidobacteriota bacterium]